MTAVLFGFANVRDVSRGAAGTMFLYDVRLQDPTAVTAAAIGNFAGTKQQEIVVARNSVLELLRPDTTTGRVHTLLSREVFGVIRSLQAFRLTGGSKDYIIAGSDSGRIVILEYNADKNVFVKVHEETYGKSAVRRVVPGQYLAADPKGRAVMIGAVEKQKLVYILNRDASAALTISSPLEAHKSSTLCYACVGVDVGFENPVFACLELDYTEADQDPTGDAVDSLQKMLTYYELDLGLNHVVRKWSEPVDARANMLVPVPGGTDGPSGVLVCSENFITWRHQGKPELRCPIPRRKDPMDDPTRGLLIVSATMHKAKNMFFFLLQSELGDTYKVTVDYELDTVKDIKIQYFDTLPIASAMCVIRAGFLFVASEFGNHALYQFASLGDDNEVGFSASAYAHSTMMREAMGNAEEQLYYFEPHPLKNLVLTDDISSLCAIVDAKVMDLAREGTPQVYMLCGRGSQSSLKTLRNGLEVTQLVSMDLSATPMNVWTVKARATDEHDAYIVLSFINYTMVLSIGEVVSEVTDSGFLGTTNTIAAAQIGDDALVQVYSEGVRHIKADRRVSEWKVPMGRSVLRAAINQHQVILALTGGILVYFELDNYGQLNEFQERKEMSAEVTSLAVGPIPEGRKRCRFLAVGSADNTVRILSLDPDDCLQGLSMQALPAIPESLRMMELTEQDGSGTLYLTIGLRNGVMLRTTVDPVVGTLTDTRTRFLGTRPVKLFPVMAQKRQALMALSSRPWMSFAYQARAHLAPLSYEMLEAAASFSSEQCPEGVVAVTGSTLRILLIDKLGTVFHSTSVPLKYTPRRFVPSPISSHVIIIETEHQTISPDARKKAEPDSKKRTHATEEDGAATGMEVDATADGEYAFPVKAKAGNWSSCIRVVDTVLNETTFVEELEDNEAAFCITSCIFQERPHETFVIVGTGKDVLLAPRMSSAGFLRVYKVVDGGARLQLLHKTQIEEPPSAMSPFQGRLLVAFGRHLRIYDMGKKKLLRKCENKLFPNVIVGLLTQGDRIVVADVQESFSFVKYRAQDNQLYIFADDTMPRWITCGTMLDYNTVAGADKFGNFFINRLADKTSTEIDDDTMFSKTLLDRGNLNGAFYKTDNLVNFHVGDTITSLNRCVLVPGGNEVLLYTTLLGSIGAFVPFTSKEEIDFFQHLEMHMRNEAAPLLGRDHLWYRSWYHPVKATIDGTLCEQFNVLPIEKRRAIASELDRTPAEILKKLEDQHNRVAY